jgi:hypothetical protein
VPCSSLGYKGVVVNFDGVVHSTQQRRASPWTDLLLLVLYKYVTCSAADVRNTKFSMRHSEFRMTYAEFSLRHSEFSLRHSEFSPTQHRASLAPAEPTKSR